MQVAQSATWRTETSASGRLSIRFIALFAALVTIAGVAIARWPIRLSILTVFLFAGPHNWVEFRYFLGRMPARWGRSKAFFTVGLSGVAILTIAYLGLYLAGDSWYLDVDTWTTGISIWNTTLVLWVATLVLLRGRQVAGRDWSWAFAAGFALCAVAWSAPLVFSLALVYIHPLISLWFVDRELARRNAAWQKSFRVALLAVPFVLVAMWTMLARASNLDDSTALAWRITQHAGSTILPGVSSHLLVATHVFLETIHYSVWLVLIPFMGMGASIVQIRRIPLAVSKRGWPRTVIGALIAGLVFTALLWVSFAFNYSTTRDVYFAFAVAHVLAEAPFLIRML